MYRRHMLPANSMMYIGDIIYIFADVASIGFVKV